MRLNHPDYIRLVSEAYKKKRASNELSPLLSKSTPAKIRQECLNLYHGGCDKKDHQTLRTFFGPAEHGKAFLQLIRDFETDKFKPLDNYLKGITEKTDDKNVELLAWLIDFKFRPFVIGMNVILDEGECFIIKENVEDNATNEMQSSVEQTDSNKDRIILNTVIKDEAKNSPQEIENLLPSNRVSNSPKKGIKKGIVILFCLLISFAGLYIYRENDSSKKTPNGNTNTIKVAKGDTIFKQRADSLIPGKKDNLVISANANKKNITSSPIVLDSTRCLRITKKGMQCKRKPKANGYCWQHGGVS